MARATAIFLLSVVCGCATPHVDRPAPRATRRPAEEPRPAPPSRVVERPAFTVDLDVKDAPVAKVLAEISRQVDRPIALLGTTEERLTLTVHSAPWRDVLAYVAGRARLVQRRDGETLVYEARPRTTFQAQDADASAWLRALASGAGKSVVLPGHLPGAVTLELHDVSYEEALRATAETYGYEVILVSDD